MHQVISLDPKSIGGLRIQSVTGALAATQISSPVVPSGINKLILGLAVRCDDLTAGNVILASYELPGAGACFIPLDHRTYTVNPEWCCAVGDFWLPSGWRINAYVIGSVGAGKQIVMTWTYIDVLQI